MRLQQSDQQRNTFDHYVTEKRGSATQSRRIVTGIVSIFLAVIVWIALGQAVRHEFVRYDDYDYVVQNPSVTNGFTLDGIQWAFTHVHASNWHPLTTIS